MARAPLSTFLRCLRRAVAPSADDGLTDGVLLERFVTDGDAAAFELLVWRHGPMVLGVCRRLLGHEQDSEDAFQATFLTLVHKARSIARRQAVGAWIYRVAYRIACRARARKPWFEPLVTEPPAPAVNDPVADLCPVLDEEIERLPARYRRPLVLCYLNGKTSREAAQELGCPEGTVVSWLSRGRQKLRSRLARRGVALPAGALATLLVQERAAAVPAVLVQSITRVAVPYAAGKSAVGLGISAQAAAWTQGALQAMWLNKLKMLTLGVLALGVLGSGLGAVALRARPAAVVGPEQDVAQGLNKTPAEQRPADKEGNRRADIEKTRRALDDLEAVFTEHEAQWTNEVIDARKAMIEIEARLQLLERKHTTEREREDGKLRALQDIETTLQGDIKRLKAILEERRRPSENALKDDEATLKRKTESLREVGDEIRKMEVLIEDREPRRTAELVKAKQDKVVAEEHLLLLERRQATQRDKMLAKREAVEARQRQLDEPDRHENLSQRRVAELERKLDQVLRELAELRRELRK
jgi:RNA polymerase sigma factor (sigma-70 family)